MKAFFVGASEKLTNNIFSINFGRDIDITAGSCLMSNKALETIKAHSSADVTDAEWPFIIKKYEGESSIDYLEYNGLEYLDWNKSSANSDIDEWLGRTKLTYRIVKTISHFVKE